MPPLLERDAELALLQDVVVGLAAGRGRLVLLGGEAGIGKTSLVRELRARTGPAATFLAGACEPLSVPVPLAPLRELADAAGERDPAALEGADRLQLARRLLAALAAKAPAVAVVEDAHWADPATLDVVRLLARRLEEKPVAVVLTYRDDEVAANPALRQLLGDLATSPVALRIVLRPLSEAAVGELARPANVDPVSLSRLTGGNPFLVVESIAAGNRLPGSVRDAALARTSRLGARARAAAAAAAVIGQRVDPALLEAVAPDSGDAVEEALARGVLVADGASLGFRHELTRDAIESSIPPTRRAELHARVVAALEARPGADHARLAHHAELAGLRVEASRYAALAAAEAHRVGALREATLQAERALRLGESLSDPDRIELLIRHSRAANFASLRLEDAVESAREAIALASRTGDVVREGRGLVALAFALWSLDRVGESRAAAEAAVAVLEHAGDRAALARAQATLLRVEATAFDPAVVLELGQRALELAAANELQETRIDLAISIGLARGHLGDPEALDALAEAAREARAAGLPIQTVRAYVNLVFVSMTWRRHELTDELATEALTLFDDYQTTIPANAVQLYRARSLIDRGRWAEADETLTMPDREWAAETAVVSALGALLGARRGAAAADSLIERAWAEMGEIPESSRHGLLRVARVESAWLRGDRAAAQRLLRAAAGNPAVARHARTASDLAVWGRRAGVDLAAAPHAPEPVLLELAGDWRGAVRAWRELEAPYEAALAALPGDDRSAQEALATLHRLGARGSAQAFARERERLGGRTLRGPRRSTLVHPAGLTRREQEVLEQLASGATNARIAGALHLSERTVAHHVSAILRKLDSPTRVAALARARERGLLAQDRPPASPT